MNANRAKNSLRRFRRAKRVWELLSPVQQRCFYLKYIEKLCDSTISTLLKIDRLKAEKQIEYGENKIFRHFYDQYDFLAIVRRFYPMIVLADEEIGGFISRRTPYHDGRTFQVRSNPKEKSQTVKKEF